MDTTELTTEAHQTWIRTVTVKVGQGVLLLMAVFMALVLVNGVSDDKSDAKDFAECISANVGPCD